MFDGSNDAGNSRANMELGAEMATRIRALAPQVAEGIIANSRGVDDVNASKVNLEDSAGRRVRLRPKPGGIGTFYGPDRDRGLLKPLVETNGMVFPYRPVITYQQEVSYQPMEMVHTNQDFHSYSRTPALKLQLDGDFTVQNQKEGQYAMACIQFLRTATKMWFGGSTTEAVDMQGTPPPVLLFDAYGQFMFNSLPVIVTTFTIGLPNEVDYVAVDCNPLFGSNQTPIANQLSRQVGQVNSNTLRPNGEGYAYLPAHFKIQVGLMVQNTPRRLRGFDMTKFRSGELLKGGSWI